MLRSLVFRVAAFFVVAGGLHAQEAEHVNIGERLSMYSEVLGEDRPYWVYLPASYDQERYTPQHYPVLYLLDGNAHFHSVTGVIQFMSTGINGNLQAPEMIVVAIPNTDRMRDLTPTAAGRAYDGSEMDAVGGGGDAFLQFMRDELFPEIEANYRTRPYRVFVGHSLGGLMALHALVEHPQMFQAHIAIDPSLWWNDNRLLQKAETYFAESDGLTGAVYLTMANNPPPEPGGESRMRTTGEAFSRAMAAAESETFRTDSRFFEAEDHGSVPLISLYHGLLHVFDGYKPPLRELIESPAAVTAHFETVSERFGFEIKPPEPTVDQLGYVSLGQDVDRAIEFFQINVDNYPGSYNAHASLAEGFAAKGETDRAVASLQRSLDLNPSNSAARTRLAELRSLPR